MATYHRGLSRSVGKLLLPTKPETTKKKSTPKMKTYLIHMSKDRSVFKMMSRSITDVRSRMIELRYVNRDNAVEIYGFDNDTPDYLGSMMTYKDKYYWTTFKPGTWEVSPNGSIRRLS